MKDVQISFYRNACDDIAAEIKLQNERIFSSERATQIALALYLLGASEFTYIHDEQQAKIPVRPDTFSFIPGWAWQGMDESAFWLQLTAGIMSICTTPVYEDGAELHAVRARFPSYLVDGDKAILAKRTQINARATVKKGKQYGRAI